MANEIAVVEEKQKKQLATVRDLLEKSENQLRAACRSIDPKRIVRISLTSLQKNPDLLDCAPVTFVGAIIQSVQLGLEPDTNLGLAHLVPFWNSKKNRYEVQFMPGYKGLLELARRSGYYTTFEARVVHEKDEFDYEYGIVPRLVHKPCKEQDPGKPLHVYAIARLKDSKEVQFDVMSIREIEAIRQRSQAGKDRIDKTSKKVYVVGPWKTDYEEMCKKTVLRRLCKMLPMSTEMAKAVALDDKAAVDLPQDLGTLASDDELGTAIEPSGELSAPAETKAQPVEPLSEGEVATEQLSVVSVTPCEGGVKPEYEVATTDGKKLFTENLMDAKLCKEHSGKGTKLTMLYRSSKTEAGEKLVLLQVKK